LLEDAELTARCRLILHGGLLSTQPGNVLLVFFKRVALRGRPYFTDPLYLNLLLTTVVVHQLLLRRQCSTGNPSNNCSRPLRLPHNLLLTFVRSCRVFLATLVCEWAGRRVSQSVVSSRVVAFGGVACGGARPLHGVDFGGLEGISVCQTPLRLSRHILLRVRHHHVVIGRGSVLRTRPV